MKKPCKILIIKLKLNIAIFITIIYETIVLKNTYITSGQILFELDIYIIQLSSSLQKNNNDIIYYKLYYLFILTSKHHNAIND